MKNSIDFKKLLSETRIKLITTFIIILNIAYTSVVIYKYSMYEGIGNSLSEENFLILKRLTNFADFFFLSIIFILFISTWVAFKKKNNDYLFNHSAFYGVLLVIMLFISFLAAKVFSVSSAEIVITLCFIIIPNSFVLLYSMLKRTLKPQL